MASWFSRSAALKRIAQLPGPQAGFSLLYLNGRRIALDASGILNSLAPGVGRFEFGPVEWDGRLGKAGSMSAPDSRRLRERLTRIVLKSLLRYIRQPSDDPRQRDFAAHAVSLICMASRNRRAAGLAHAGPEGFLGMGSARETAPLF
ncbi:MAG: hypothetical protein ABIW76_05665 [Fibrobacteria bacterium]